LQEEKEIKKVSFKLSKEQQETKEVSLKLKNEENKKLHSISNEVLSHSEQCSCDTAKTAAEKESCIAACKTRQVILKKKVNDYVEETSSVCAVKATIACGHLKNKAECNQCKKEFVVLCIDEENKRKNELVSLLESCDD